MKATPKPLFGPGIRLQNIARLGTAPNGDLGTYGQADSFYYAGKDGSYVNADGPSLSISGSGAEPAASIIAGFKWNRAVTSPPAGRYFLSPSSLQPGSGDFIVECIASPQNSNFAEKAGSYDGSSGWYIGFDGDSDPFLWIRDGAVAVSPAIPGESGVPGHYMWFISRANNFVHTYRDGVFQATTNISSLTGPVSGDAFRIGSSGTGTPSFSTIGYWDSVTVAADNNSTALARYNELSE